MAATKQRTSQARRARPATPKRGAKSIARAAGGGGNSHPDLAAPKRVVKTAARKAFKAIARKTAEAGAQAIRRAADRAAGAGKGAVDAAASRRLPIQVSVDVAVPLEVAWDEWMSFGSLPEGVHRLEHVERDGDRLFGRTSGPRGTDWDAEIVDERDHESFAWRSVKGTDCAGLVTFHRLSDRLTRIELDLDVLPTNPAQAATLALHLTHRRAEADLRRFKAHVEFINPDVYESDGRENGGKGKRSARNKQRED